MAKEIKLDAIAALNPYEVVRLSAGVVTIGREPENGIVVDSDLISRRHAGVYEVGSQWIYRDLGSTNGSWVNGMEVKAGQPRLLRDGDVIRVADFPLQMNYTSSASELANSPSLIILLSDKFDQELAMEEGDGFFIGGEQASIVIDDLNNIELGSIIFSSNEFSLMCSPSTSSKTVLMVNGVLAKGNSKLHDRDLVSVGHYTFIVNLPQADSREEGMRYAERVRKETSEELAKIAAYDSANLPEHLKSKKRDEGWESQSARRRSTSGKMFVFGSEPAGSTFGQTQSVSTSDIRSKLGYEMSPSQRFRGSFGAPVVDEKSRKKIHRMLSLIGAFIFFCVVAAVVYFLFLKK